MATKFNKSKLASAVAAAVLGLGLSSGANAVVVVGGDNGWEVSFDGNINAFYVMSDNDVGYDPLGYSSPNAVDPGLAPRPQEDISRVASGFLPAFFSFNVKSPTVNGMTATGRISFAPVIHGATTKNDLYAPGTPGNVNITNGIQGSSMDTREVLVNIDGSFGTVSFGRTLSIFGRQAILNDMTLMGVGSSNMDGAGVQLGRAGRGYTYPNFNARFSYKTPVMSGFQAELGLYDPSVEQLNGSFLNADILDQTDTPRFEGELTYATTFANGSFKAWVDGLWQDLESTLATSLDGEATVAAWGAGASASYMGFGLTGYYYDGEGLGRSLQFFGGTACDATGNFCEEAENDGYYVQGTYTFAGRTKLGVSYGESNEDAFSTGRGLLTVANNQDASLSMWTVGVYHDVNSWLKLIAEYSKAENEFSANAGAGLGAADAESDIFSIGSFFVW